MKFLILAVSLSGIFTITGQAQTSLDYLNNILKGNEQNIDKNIKRLSEGTLLLIDDPANFSIYQKLEGHIRGLSKEIENAANVMYYYQYAESMLRHIIDVVQRIRELILRRGNPIYTEADRSLVDAEIQSHYDGILFLLRNTDFNGKTIFTSFFDDESFSTLFKADLYYQLGNVDRLLSFFINMRSIYGAKMNQLESRQRAMMVERENAQGFQSTIFDLDYASEITLLRRNELLLLANILLLGSK